MFREIKLEDFPEEISDYSKEINNSKLSIRDRVNCLLYILDLQDGTTEAMYFDCMNHMNQLKEYLDSKI
mgnify:CR=1 FL=1